MRPRLDRHGHERHLHPDDSLVLASKCDEAACKEQIDGVWGRWRQMLLPNERRQRLRDASPRGTARNESQIRFSVSLIVTVPCKVISDLCKSAAYRRHKAIAIHVIDNY